ncbi:MAG TPA: hypothetical protein PKD59_10840 [Miltoncostaeaceae bacterium]|nr:hypothetical protein [Miltoncostaeaceae bacterium]
MNPGTRFDVLVVAADGSATRNFTRFDRLPVVDDPVWQPAAG